MLQIMKIVTKREIPIKETDLEVVLVLLFVIHVVMILMADEWVEFRIETMETHILVMTDVIDAEIWLTEEEIKDLADIREKEIIEGLEI
jgi:hypothetical protein